MFRSVWDSYISLRRCHGTSQTNQRHRTGVSRFLASRAPTPAPTKTMGIGREVPARRRRAQNKQRRTEDGLTTDCGRISKIRREFGRQKCVHENSSNKVAPNKYFETSPKQCEYTDFNRDQDNPCPPPTPCGVTRRMRCVFSPPQSWYPGLGSIGPSSGAHRRKQHRFVNVRWGSPPPRCLCVGRGGAPRCSESKAWKGEHSLRQQNPSPTPIQTSTLGKATQAQRRCEPRAGVDTVALGN